METVSSGSSNPGISLTRRRSATRMLSSPHSPRFGWNLPVPRGFRLFRTRNRAAEDVYFPAERMMVRHTRVTIETWVLQAIEKKSLWQPDL